MLYIALGSVSPFFCATIIMPTKIFDKELSWDVRETAENWNCKRVVTLKSLSSSEPAAATQNGSCFAG